MSTAKKVASPKLLHRLDRERSHSFPVLSNLISILQWFLSRKILNKATSAKYACWIIKIGYDCTNQVAKKTWNIGEIWNPLCYHGNETLALTLAFTCFTIIFCLTQKTNDRTQKQKPKPKKNWGELKTDRFSIEPLLDLSVFRIYLVSLVCHFYLLHNIYELLKDFGDVSSLRSCHVDDKFRNTRWWQFVTESDEA